MSPRSPILVATLLLSPAFAACVKTTLEVPENHPGNSRYVAAPVPSLAAFSEAKPAPSAPPTDHSHHHHHHHEPSAPAPEHDHGGKP